MFSALIFKKPLFYVFRVALFDVFKLFACTFNCFPKGQLPSNLTDSQFIPLVLVLESSACNPFMLINIYINVNACKKYFLVLTLTQICNS